MKRSESRNSRRSNRFSTTRSMATSSMHDTNGPPGKIPLGDQITLGPIQKYKKYDVFPWDFVIHIIIVLLTTLQILAMVETTGGYSRNQANLFFTKFLASPDDNDDVVSFIIKTNCRTCLGYV